MGKTPYEVHWWGDADDPGDYPPGWVKLVCPRCKRVIAGPAGLVGRLVCTACMPASVLLIGAGDPEKPAASNGSKGGSDAAS